MKRNSAKSKIEAFEPAEDIERSLGLPPGYLKQRRASHSGPRYHLIGRVVLYKESDVRAWSRARGRKIVPLPKVVGDCTLLLGRR